MKMCFFISMLLLPALCFESHASSHSAHHASAGDNIKYMIEIEECKMLGYSREVKKCFSGVLEEKRLDDASKVKMAIGLTIFLIILICFALR